MSHTKNMKLSNCLKLVLLCGCPPENSNFQLQLGQADEITEEDSKKSTLITDQPDTCSRSELRSSRSMIAINKNDTLRKRKKGKSDTSFNSDEISNQDEQKAIALILEYLKMKYPSSSKDELQESPSDVLTQQKAEESKWKGKKFEKSKSMIEKNSSFNNRNSRTNSYYVGMKLANEKPTRKQFKLDDAQESPKVVRKTSNCKFDKSKENLRLKKSEVDHQINKLEGIVLEKEWVKASKVKMPVSFFSRLTSRTVMRSKTVVETSDLEIKEIIVTEKNEPNQKNPKNGSFKNGYRSKSSFIPSRNKSDQRPEQENRHIIDKPLSSDVAIILNPNLLDEVSPYVLRFVKHYLGDFRRYLLDVFIGVDSISLDYFDSMIKAIDNFPIDDLTLFKNIKYTLATLFPHEDTKLMDIPHFKKYEDIRTKYHENLQKKHIIEPSKTYRYTIKTMKPVNFDVKAMGDAPSFLVRYYPRGNKLHRNQYSQTDIK